MKKRFTEEQIIGFLREAEAGLGIKDLCRRHGFSEASYYLWRSKFGGMTVSEAKRGLPKVIRTDNGKEFCGRVMLRRQHRGGSACSRDPHGVEDVELARGVRFAGLFVESIDAVQGLLRGARGRSQCR